MLAGFFPLELTSHLPAHPGLDLALWRYPHCFLGTPLLRRSSAEACLETFFDWALQPSHPWRLLELGRVSGEGSFHRLLLEQIGKRALFAYRAESYVRALFEPAEDADVYLQRSLPGKKRKELRRQINRLTELGQVEFDELDGEGDPAPWIEQFLSLEASGWKGEEGTALLSSEEDRRFFRSIARDAFDRGALSMLALRLDGEAIAMKCNVERATARSRSRSHSTRRTRASRPASALEIESIRRMHDRGRLRWMDSCAEPGHPMIDRLWTERRLIETLVVVCERDPPATSWSLSFPSCAGCRRGVARSSPRSPTSFRLKVDHRACRLPRPPRRRPRPDPIGPGCCELDRDEVRRKFPEPAVPHPPSAGRSSVVRAPHG